MSDRFLWEKWTSRKTLRTIYRKIGQNPLNHTIQLLVWSVCICPSNFSPDDLLFIKPCPELNLLPTKDISRVWYSLGDKHLFLGVSLTISWIFTGICATPGHPSHISMGWKCQGQYLLCMFTDKVTISDGGQIGTFWPIYIYIYKNIYVNIYIYMYIYINIYMQCCC